MAINPHHTTEMLEGKLCAVVEKGISQERASHICEILKANGFEVAIQEQNEKVTVGVTDILFNPVMAVYNRYLKTKDGRVVTPAIWSHNDSSFSDLYWLRR